MDTSLFYFFYNLGQKINTDGLIVFLGSYLIYLAVAIFLFLLFKEKDLKKRVYWINLFLLVEIAGRGVLTQAIRFFYDRPRPFASLGLEPLISHSPGGSFPSGHDVFLLILVFIVFLINKKWGWILTLITILVAVSRVIAGIHWTLDVFGSLVVALVSFGLIYYLLMPPKKFITSDQNTS